MQYIADQLKCYVTLIEVFYLAGFCSPAIPVLGDGNRNIRSSKLLFVILQILDQPLLHEFVSKK